MDAGVLRIDRADPDGPEARRCIAHYYDELRRRFAEGFDATLSAAATLSAFAPPTGVFLVATIDRRPVACGGITTLDPGTAYLKRMWVDGSMRGMGLGRTMLSALEGEAAELGRRRVVLETNRALVEAIRLYRTAGYREVPPFNDEHYADHWFEKTLEELPER